MIKRSFTGGIHPYEGKHFTEKKKIEPLPKPKAVYVPLQQHIGALCVPAVKKGDKIKPGEVVGDVKIE